jgi:Na+/melibiose symporter-like transporter
LLQIGHALRLKSFRVLLTSGVIGYAAAGVGSTLTVYLTTYFFQFSPLQLAWLPLAIVLGGMLSVPIAPWLTARIDKKNAALFAGTGFALLITLPYSLRLLGWMPPNGDLLLLPALVANNVLAYTCLYVGYGLAGSMMADVADEYELVSGKRQEGVFFSTQSFAFKSTFGLGTFFAGIAIDLIHFPRQAAVGEVPAQAILGLGVIAGPVLCVVHLLTVAVLFLYPIDALRYQRIRDALEARIVPGRVRCGARCASPDVASGAAKFHRDR